MYNQTVRPLVAIFLVLFYPCVILAEDAQVLHWSDIETAIDRHPEMQLAESATKAAKSEIKLSRQYPNPEIGVSLGQARSIDGTEKALTWGIELEIPIETPGSYIFETKAAKVEYQAAKSDAILKRLEVVRELKSLFYSIAIGQEHLKIQQENISQLQKLVNIARLRVEQGEARQMEVMRLEIELEKQQVELSSVEKSLESARKRLNLWLGNKLPSDYSVAFSYLKLPKLLDKEELFKRSIAKHPILKSASLRIKSAKAHKKAELHRLFPKMSIGGFYGRELDAHNYGGMLNIELPLWNWNQGGISKAGNNENIAFQEKELAEKRLKEELLEAHAITSESIERAFRYKDAILPKATKTNEMLIEMYQVGETSLVDVLDSRQTLNQIKTEMLTAIELSWLSYLNLVTLLGGEYE